jgi:hypothetical protein
MSDFSVSNTTIIVVLIILIILFVYYMSSSNAPETYVDLNTVNNARVNMSGNMGGNMGANMAAMTRPATQGRANSANMNANVRARALSSTPAQQRQQMLTQAQQIRMESPVPPTPMTPSQAVRYNNQNPVSLDNTVEDSLVDEFIQQYGTQSPTIQRAASTFGPYDPSEAEQGPFNDYIKKRQFNFKKMEQPFSSDLYNEKTLSYDQFRNFDQGEMPQGNNAKQSNNFTFKRQKFVLKPEQNIQDEFNVDNYLPQQVEKDWFDVEPVETTKQIKGNNLINPKVFIGVNTVASSRRNASHDLRGDVPAPKVVVSPWLQSTIEPDTNLVGISNPI